MGLRARSYLWSMDFTIVPACFQAFFGLYIRWYSTLSALCYLLLDMALLQSHTELMKRFLYALLLFALVSYIYNTGSSWFLSLCKITWVFRGLPAILEFRFYVAITHLFGLCYNCVFAFDSFGLIGMLCWETSQYLHCVVVTLACPLKAGPLGWGILIIGMASFLVWLSHIGLLVWGAVRVHISLLDYSLYIHMAPNTRIPCNTHTHNHLGRIIVYVLHFRVVMVGGKQCWFLDEK